MCQLIVKEARCLTHAVESLAKETGDHVSDHLFATLRNQFAEVEEVLEEVEQLGKIVQTYQTQIKQAMTKIQL